MRKDKYILNIINEINGVLSKNNYRENRYNRDIAWFEERKSIYDDNIIRIAIMGITSSGKSTLVNALLGEKILPMAIRPSSSIIITASKGLKRQAIIYFKDSKPKILETENLNEDAIAEYADESKNPGNKLNVTQIDIKTPYFMLDENIHIIDSPGLDAWNLENHEKLTLEILLPTIDICIFVTTVKANSDATNAEKIKIVSEKEKQIILVQNMIDSIEEKIGKNGIVEEDKITILKKHKKRAEKILREITDDKKISEVIQISALNALKGIVNKDDERYANSNFDMFIKTIENCAENTIPKLNGQRAESLIEKIDNIISTDEKIINGNNLGEIEALINVNNKEIDNLANKFECAQNEIAEKIKEIENVITRIMNEISSVSSENIEDYLDIVDRINNKNLYIESDILSTVKRCEKAKRRIYDSLNLDIRSSYVLPSIESRNIEIKHKYEERTMLFKKEGVLNKGKRLLSNIFDKEWGYKEVGYDERIIDKDETIKMAQKICSENKGRYISILKEWSNQYTKVIDTFYEEVARRTDEFEEKKEQNIELYDIGEVNKELIAIKGKLSNLRVDVKSEVAVTNDNYEKNISYNISNMHYNFYMLSNKVLEKNYLLVGKYINKKCEEKFENRGLKLFWTWDIDSCRDFISRIYGIDLGSEECEVIKREGLYRFGDIAIIYESGKGTLKFYEKLRNIKDMTYSMFIIFNGIQIGNSKKQILESRNLNYFFKDNSNLSVNLVIDSCREFINANNIEELLIEVKSLKDKVISRFNSIRPEYILINSKNPIYNMALIELQEIHEFLISDYKVIKEKLIENPLSRGAEEQETIEKILSYFLNTSKEEGV
ncbi:dynamin family protein [Clostridium beijerinckii]|uniref:dynamin family protein n=1 Tax=Clostridium beijerinckii TaxID=1520 RepID=UPI00047E0D60|nr:dynamin family protein [Clostridium beijerinckii]